TLLTITFMTLGSVEPQISRNLSDSARARQLAESGIEWGFNQLAGRDFNDATLLGSGTTTGGVNCGPSITCKVLTTGQTLPGLTTTAGTFTVTLRNDLSTVSGDQALIGGTAATNPRDTSATIDNNKIVILKSVGTFNGASKTITAVVQRGNLPINAAVSLPGVQGDTFSQVPPCAISVGCYSIDGRDWTDSQTWSSSATPAGVGSLKYGMTAATQAIELLAQNGFNSLAKREYLRGRDDSDGYAASTDGSGGTGKGRNTIADDGTLTSGMIQKFMQNLASNPSTQILNSTMACQYPAAGGDHDKPEGIKMQSTGTPNIVTVTNNCSTGPDAINQTVNLGSAASPSMLYVKGEFDPDSLFRGLTVDGSDPITGYGILVVEDSDLGFFQTGQFRWNGIVLVTGRNNSTAFLGNSNTEIRGALIVNETNPLEVTGFSEFAAKTDGTMRILSSKENIDRALMALYNMRISAFREN
ncbi:MAG TPA: hypothetical protein VLA89_01015, partial [Gemmatimonadales bacterium]|nr:hypothetical protein [Gemmatimonadales bacterium]